MVAVVERLWARPTVRPVVLVVAVVCLAMVAMAQEGRAIAAAMARVAPPQQALRAVAVALQRAAAMAQATPAVAVGRGSVIQLAALRSPTRAVGAAVAILVAHPPVARVRAEQGAAALPRMAGAQAAMVPPIPVVAAVVHPAVPVRVRHLTVVRAAQAL